MKGVWGKPCFPQGGLGVYPQSVRKRAPGVLRGVTLLKRLQGAASSQSPFMLGAVGKRHPSLHSLAPPFRQKGTQKSPVRL